MTRIQLLEKLKSMNIKSAIADPRATADNTPAILLRRDGEEEYYTGFDLYEYEEWLEKEFSDKEK